MRVRPRVILASLLATLLCTSGCGTLFNDTRHPVQVQSQTPGAQILVDGMPAGVTPAMIFVDSHRDHMIQVTTPDGRTFVCAVRSGVGAVWIILDILCAVWPLIVDAITGDWAESDSDICFAPI